MEDINISELKLGDYLFSNKEEYQRVNDYISSWSDTTFITILKKYH